MRSLLSGEKFLCWRKINSKHRMLRRGGEEVRLPWLQVTYRFCMSCSCRRKSIHRAAASVACWAPFWPKTKTERDGAGRRVLLRSARAIPCFCFAKAPLDWAYIASAHVVHSYASSFQVCLTEVKKPEKNMHWCACTAVRACTHIFLTGISH